VEENVLNEIQAYAPICELQEEFQLMEFDIQIPEYINPDWNDDALYNLICANQDALVEVCGRMMTLSEAMNAHPGPWIPENEANLMAYAENLLASMSSFELLTSEEQETEPAENEQTTPLYEFEDLTSRKNSRYVEPDDEYESHLTQQEKDPSLQSSVEELDVLEHSLEEPAEFTYKTDIDFVDKQIDHNDSTQAVKLISTPETVIHDTEPECRAEDTKQREPAHMVEVEGESSSTVRQCESSSPSEMTTVRVTTEFTGETHAQSDTVIDTEELNPANEWVHNVIEDALVGSQVLKEQYEETVVTFEVTSGDAEVGSLTDYCPETEEDEPIDTPEHNDLQSIIPMVVEVEDTLIQLAEIIGSVVAEDEEIITITRKILEAPIKLDIVTQEEWAKFYVDIFEAVGLSYSPELIERLSVSATNWNLIDEIERLDDVEIGMNDCEDENTSAIVRKLIVTVVSIIQSIRHVFSIGSYVIKILFASRVDFQ
jgi:hypothetical protein